MQKKRIAVISATIRGFEGHVRHIYEGLPQDKSMVVGYTGRTITIEHPIGVVSKYIAIQDTETSMGWEFDSVERAPDFELLENGHKVLEVALNRVR